MGPLLAAGLFCMWSLMKDPLLNEKCTAVVEEMEKEKGKKPSLALVEISTKEKWGVG